MIFDNMKHIIITIAVVLLVGCAHGTVPRKAITSDDAPAALGPYSPGVQVGEFLFLSGQIGLNPESGKLVEVGIKEQTKQVLDNLGAVKRVVKTGGNYTWMAAGRKGTPSEGMIYLISNKDWMARFNLLWLLQQQKKSSQQKLTT